MRACFGWHPCRSREVTVRKYVVVAALCAVATLCLASGVRPSVTGTVVDTEGKPLAHATVTVYHAGVRTGYSTFCPSCYRDCGRRVKTDAAGSFALRDLAPDLWFTLLAVDDGYVPRISAKVDPEKSAGVRLVLASRVHAPGAGSVLRGRVTDTSGSPVVEAVVRPVGPFAGRRHRPCSSGRVHLRDGGWVGSTGGDERQR